MSFVFIKPNDFHLQSFCYKRQDFILLYAQIVLKRLYTPSLSTDEHLNWFSILPIVTWASVSMAVSDVGITSNNYTLTFISNGDTHKPHQDNKKTMHCCFAKTYVLVKKIGRRMGGDDILLWPWTITWLQSRQKNPVKCSLLGTITWYTKFTFKTIVLLYHYALSFKEMCHKVIKRVMEN